MAAPWGLSATGTLESDGARLSFERPVERGLVHRRAVAEVFVTDFLPLGADEYAVAVQLPRAHALFGDQVPRPGRPPAWDLMLLLECARQAGTVVAHEGLGVPRGTAFLIGTWDLEIEDPESAPEAAEGPHGLVIVVRVRQVRRAGGRVLGATLDLEFMAGDHAVAHSMVTASYLPAVSYARYRLGRRGSPAPTSDAARWHRAGLAVPGDLVGRLRGENGLLSDGVWADGQAEALVDVPPSHPTFYDHPLDHLPAMALLEAARQAATLALPAGAAAVPRRMSAAFERVVELDAPTRVVARVRGADGGSVAGPRVGARFDQLGATACKVDLTFIGAAGDDAAGGGSDRSCG